MGEKKKILLIEEDLFLARLAAADLEGEFSAAYELYFAYNWIEAVKILRECRFELIIIDLDIISNDQELELHQVFSFIHSIDLDYRILPVLREDSEFIDNDYVFMRLGVENKLFKPWNKKDFIEIITEVTGA